MKFTLQEQVEKSLKEKNPELLIIKLGEGTTLDKIESITKGKYRLSDFDIQGDHMMNTEAGIAAIYSEEMIETHNTIKETRNLIKGFNNNESSKFLVVPRNTEDEINYMFRENVVGEVKCNEKTFNVYKGENNLNDPTIYYVIPKNDAPKVTLKETKEKTKRFRV